MYPYESYQKTQIMEAAPEDLILQLYQGAIVRIKQAQDLWSRGEEDAARQKRLQAMDIVCYLDETLDREASGDVIEELEALYAYMIREFTASIRHDDFESLTAVEDILQTLYQGWKDAVAEVKSAQTKSQEEVKDCPSQQGQQPSSLGAIG